MSASLLQGDTVFRQATHRKVKDLEGDEAFDFFNVPSLASSDFQIMFVIVGSWRGRSIADALPFFSKVNFERTVTRLEVRDFKVSIARVDTGR